MTRKFPSLVTALILSAVSLTAQQPSTTPAPAPAAQAPTAQAAQSPDQSGEQSDVNAPTIKINANEVNLIFTVTDKHGHYNPNLQQSDFALLDDQKAPAHVNSFHQQINLPLRVGIVVDASTSIRSRFQFEQQSATEFLLEILKAKSDRAFVMGFDVTPTVTQDWTNNVDALETGVNRLRPGGGTALFDAVYTACRDKMLDVARGQEPVRKAIVLLSDGDDNQSRVRPDEASRNANALKRSSTPSAPTGRQAAARATRYSPIWPSPLAARSSSRLRWKKCRPASRALKRNCAANMR